ncbi:MAG: hypothetical protein HOC77_00975 [Chloroflexi bacterium]|jgi:hypothetical protein|nr:hypothetical protein [Chloroflexota bacterium]MBT4072528.1 hypothetical protein [Chloroflexota bacterium]MBT4513649.1 hypothetical protein [Chloroflexota bacterium]MBT5318825.1 hypothetical protein [Chloroflexota bacterium]MBT6680613.1 hypothetical protein [Chloroflexota bacterium]
MTTVSLDLESPADLVLLNNAVWRYGPGWAPGLPNEGLVSQAVETPARLQAYDDSGWEELTDVAPGGDNPTSGSVDDPGIRKARSVGFTFGWYRIRVTLPERIGDFEVSGSTLWFETNIDDYGEVWIDGEWDSKAGAVQGFNVTNRVCVTDDARPGTEHVIACLAVNGPFGIPGGNIFLRWARLDFERP